MGLEWGLGRGETLWDECCGARFGWLCGGRGEAYGWVRRVTLFEVKQDPASTPMSSDEVWPYRILVGVSSGLDPNE